MGTLDTLGQFSQSYSQQLQDEAAITYGNSGGTFDDAMLQEIGQAGGAFGSLMGMWDSVFKPEVENLVQDAASYAGSARKQLAMGAAESEASQSSDAQRQAALADLQSFGVDPSSGRYAALDKASRVREAATQAGAGNAAEQQTEAVARALRSEAIQATANLPGYAGQMAGIQANLSLGGANIANQLKIAEMNNQLKLKELAMQQANQRYNASPPNQPNSKGGNGGNGSGGGGGRMGGPGGSSDPVWGFKGANGGGGGPTSEGVGGGGGNKGQPSTSTKNVAGGGPKNPDTNATEQAGPPMPATTDPFDNGVMPTDESSTAQGTFGPDGEGQMDPTVNAAGPQVDPSQGFNAGSSAFTSPGPVNQSDPWGDSNQPDGGTSGDFSNTDTSTFGQNDSSDPTGSDTPFSEQKANNQDTSDSGGDFANTDTSNFGQYNSGDGGGDTGGGDTGGDNSDYGDTSGDGGDFSNTDTSDFGNYNSDDGDFATGGFVSPRKSPSRGRKVDDVRAQVRQTKEPIRVNAGEFIMTRAAVQKFGKQRFAAMNAQAGKGRQ